MDSTGRWPSFATAGLDRRRPTDAAEAKGLPKAAIRDNNPVAFLEHKALYFQKAMVPEGEYVIPLGKAMLVRERSDVTIVSYSKALGLTLEAAQVLAAEGVEADILDLRTLKPPDFDAVLGSVRKTNRVLIVHEGQRFCGFGAELSALIQERAFHELDLPVQRVAALDGPIPYNRRLESAVLPQVRNIILTVRMMLNHDL